MTSFTSTASETTDLEGKIATTEVGVENSGSAVES